MASDTISITIQTARNIKSRMIISLLRPGRTRSAHASRAGLSSVVMGSFLDGLASCQRGVFIIWVVACLRLRVFSLRPHVTHVPRLPLPMVPMHRRKRNIVDVPLVSTRGV